MRHSTTWMAGLGAVVVLGVAAMAPRQETDIAYIMQRKLDHAHAILEALINEDFETLEDSAGALIALSDEAGWFVVQSPEFNERSRSFRASAAEIESAAKKRNLEGAALGYVDMTLKCVQCHQFLRGTRRAEAPLPEEIRALLGQTAQP